MINRWHFSRLAWPYLGCRHFKDLKDSLNPECPHYCFIEGMRPNLRAVIHVYETGKMPSQGTIYLNRGEIVRRRSQTLEIPSCGLRSILQNNDQIVQVTDCSKILASGAIRASTSKQRGQYFGSEAKSKQSSGKISFPSVRKGVGVLFDRFHFQILMKVRLCPELGGDGVRHAEAKNSRSSIKTWRA